jgi:competence protein ComEA
MSFAQTRQGRLPAGMRSCVIATILLLAVSLPLGAQETETININEATAEELTQLHGVGPVYAERIVQYREEYGPFEEPEDIIQVKGIGPKTFEENRDRIVVE